jgi:hypothetical protein
MAAEAELVRLRFARGCRCFALFEAGLVAGYGWLSAGPEWIGELGLQIRPARGEAYVWNCFTLPPQRRRGVFRELVREIVCRSAAEGLARLWIGSVEPSADKAVLEAGFAPILRFQVTAGEGVIRSTVSADTAADPALVEAALSVLALETASALERPAVTWKH